MKLKFKFNDKIIVTKRFYQGRHGHVIGIAYYPNERGNPSLKGNIPIYKVELRGVPFFVELREWEMEIYNKERK